MHVRAPVRACALIVLAVLALYAQHATGDAQTAGSPSAAAGCLDADFFSESAFVTAVPGDTKQFVVAFTNIGTCAWFVGSATQVDLGQGPVLGSPSPLSCWLVNPLSSTAYATTTTSVVAPGQLGWFTYTVKVPNGAPPATYAFSGELVSHATGAALRPVGYHQDLTVAQGSSAAIGGRVTRRATGAAVSGVSVQVHDTAFTIPFMAATDTCGYYTVRPTNATYRIQYVPASGSSLYMQWWTKSLAYDVATPVTVSAINTQILDVALSDTFAITGTVRDSMGAVVGGVTVVGWDATVACCWSFVFVSTTATGTFSLPVPEGSFRLWFDPPPGPLAQEYYKNVDDPGSAFPIPVSSASPNPSVSFQFRPTISGTITGTTTTQAWAQVWLSCAAASPISQRVVNLPAASGSPNRSGTYAIPLGPSGGASVLVRFSQSTAGIPVEQWYQGKTSCALATPILWNGTNIAGVDGLLP